MFTEEMLELAPFAKVFATGPEDLWRTSTVFTARCVGETFQ